MKIFYAIQATGNGHISRAKQIIPYLKKYGEVDIFLSGSNASLDNGLPIKHRSKGLSLFYKKHGGLSFTKTIFNNSYYRWLQDIKSLPLEYYDVVINDFESITAYSAKIKGISTVHFGHQASFLSPKTPRPPRPNRTGEIILKNYAPATHYLGLHFREYDDYIKPPIIKEDILSGYPTDHGHITVYLPYYQKKYLQKLFHSLPHLTFHWFLPCAHKITQEKNTIIHPINNDQFTKSLLSCHGIITGGGFETPSEALYLNKKIIIIPIKNHYEQECNAIAAEEFGAIYWNEIDEKKFKNHILSWTENPQPTKRIKHNNIDSTIQDILSLN